MPPSGYLVRHWRGELSLGRSYWLGCVLLGLLAGTCGAAAIAWLARTVDDARLLLSPILGVVLAMAACQVWGVVGAWRAANEAASRGRRARARLFQLFLLLGLWGAWRADTGPLWRLRDAIATGQPIAAPGVMARREGRIVDFVGTIDEASSARFAEIMARSPDVRLVRLSSPGGIVQEARAMTRLIRARGASTQVIDHCESACTIVFFAGRGRFLPEAATLGFHSYRPARYAGEVTGEVARAMWTAESVEERLYAEAGVPPWFISRIFAMPPSRMWYPEKAVLARAGFVTGFGVP